MNYEQALTTMIIEPLGMHDTVLRRRTASRPTRLPNLSCRVCLISTCCRIA